MAVVDARMPRQLTIDGKRFRARVFPVKGKEVELYRVNVLAAALDRKSSRSYFQWEYVKLVPRPVFVTREVTKMGYHRRWFSREQILNLVKVYQRFPMRAGARLGRYFFTAFRAVFYTLHEISDTDLDTLLIETLKDFPPPPRGTMPDEARNTIFAKQIADAIRAKNPRVEILRNDESGSYSQIPAAPRRFGLSSRGHQDGSEPGKATPQPRRYFSQAERAKREAALVQPSDRAISRSKKDS